MFDYASFEGRRKGESGESWEMSMNVRAYLGWGCAMYMHAWFKDFGVVGSIDTLSLLTVRVNLCKGELG